MRTSHHPIFIFLYSSCYIQSSRRLPHLVIFNGQAPSGYQGDMACMNMSCPHKRVVFLWPVWICPDMACMNMSCPHKRVVFLWPRCKALCPLPPNMRAVGMRCAASCVMRVLLPFTRSQPPHPCFVVLGWHPCLHQLASHPVSVSKAPSR